MKPILEQATMDQPNHRVKIPCNHRLEYEEMEHLTHLRIIQYKSDISSYKCIGCGNVSGVGYYCERCEFWAHEECLEWPEIINLPCHSRHPLKKVLTETIDYTYGSCQFCGEELGDEMYHCSICNFNIHFKCWRDLPPHTIYARKNHNHRFTLMARKVSFTCNACGMVGDRNPYVCLKCGFMLHIDCVYLPRVINIDRHEHRISRIYYLDHGDWECGVCRKKIDWTFGAFSCKRCPDYAVHSICATRVDVWDGKELEGEPEEEEIEDPYKVINEKEIIHFSHEEHSLRLGDDNVTDYEKMLCDACMLPINSDPFFKCAQCEFFLHKVCASLPRRKRNILHNHRLTLVVDNDPWDMPFWCRYCLQFFDGFSYHCHIDGICSIISSPFDVRCASISEPFHHELHPHPLYRTLTVHKTCGACGKESEYVLSCTVCDEFSLGMECATLPRKVKHPCDDHDLSLHHGAGNSKGPLWCDICEGKTDPSVWYYGCDDCGVTLHIKCVIGDMYYLKPGKKYKKGELVPNNGMSRPICMVCGKCCMFPSFLKGIAVSDSTVEYACSMGCARTEKWKIKEPSREKVRKNRQVVRRRVKPRSYMIWMYRRILPLVLRMLFCYCLSYLLLSVYWICWGLFQNLI